ncbi:MAG: hypothetical protein L0177_01520 [Chloroflexi bacterium]|nr:hypothetical protein [Chloroflexota bacterium]
MGDSVAFAINAHASPEYFNVSVYEKESRARGLEHHQLEPSFEMPFLVELPAGAYEIRAFGRWDEGDVVYAFSFEVAP